MCQGPWDQAPVGELGRATSNAEGLASTRRTGGQDEEALIVTATLLGEEVPQEWLRWGRFRRGVV